MGGMRAGLGYGTFWIKGIALICLLLVSNGLLPASCVAPVVSTTGDFRAAYDSNGNMVLQVEVSGAQPITQTQEYNADNRLAVVTNTVTGVVARFVYDGDGNRILLSIGLTGWRPSGTILNDWG